MEKLTATAGLVLLHWPQICATFKATKKLLVRAHLMLFSFKYIYLMWFGCFSLLTLLQSDWLLSVSDRTLSTRNSCYTHLMCAASVTTHIECESRCQSCDLLKEKLLTLLKKTEKRKAQLGLSWNLNSTLPPPLPWQGQAGSRNSSRPLIWRLHSREPGEALPSSLSLSASLAPTLPAWLSTER